MSANYKDEMAEFIRDCIIIALVSGTVMVLFGCAAGFVVGLALIFRRNIANMVMGGGRRE